jgi:hypothetical protein
MRRYVIHAKLGDEVYLRFVKQSDILSIKNPSQEQLVQRIKELEPDLTEIRVWKIA